MLKYSLYPQNIKQINSRSFYYSLRTGLKFVFNRRSSGTTSAYFFHSLLMFSHYCFRSISNFPPMLTFSGEFSLIITTIASFGTAYAFVATSVIFWTSLRFFAKFLITGPSKVIFGTLYLLSCFMGNRTSAIFTP